VLLLPSCFLRCCNATITTNLLVLQAGHPQIRLISYVTYLHDQSYIPSNHDLFTCLSFCPMPWKKRLVNSYPVGIGLSPRDPLVLINHQLTSIYQLCIS
jgi:hypothetical protein